ncbi:MAG TPA: haloalkane dehalogenase [Acidimicrobiales bacterium]|nr:haloalkane dehalogenase [Acidimicrobiales bacterium]
MEVLRTPDECFVGLPGWDVEPHYVALPDGLRVHYVDEGPRRGPVVLLLHGEPSWSYLYRKMVPPLAAAGCRVVAPDLVGFGRSDKPASRHDYTYARHVAWMAAALFGALDLRDVTLFGQDWGGLVGLRLAAEHEGRVARICAANTGLPTGDQPLSEAFAAWQQFSQEAPTLPIGRIVAGGCADPLADDVIAAYDAPFPEEQYKEGARRFPVLVPTTPDDPGAVANRAAWEVLSRWEKPFLTAFSDGDPITRGGERAFLERVPGTRGQPHATIEGAGHFLQEDRGEELARLLLDWLG